MVRGRQRCSETYIGIRLVRVCIMQKRESDKATLTHGHVSCVSHFEPRAHNDALLFPTR